LKTPAELTQVKLAVMIHYLPARRKWKPWKHKKKPGDPEEKKKKILPPSRTSGVVYTENAEA